MGDARKSLNSILIGFEKSSEGISNRINKSMANLIFEIEEVRPRLKYKPDQIVKQ